MNAEAGFKSDVSYPTKDLILISDTPSIHDNTHVTQPLLLVSRRRGNLT